MNELQENIPKRSRNTEKKERKGTLTGVLCVQCILCFILIVAAVLIKNTGGTLYTSVKQSFNNIFAESAALQDIKNTVDSYIQKIPFIGDVSRQASDPEQDEDNTASTAQATVVSEAEGGDSSLQDISTETASTEPQSSNPSTAESTSPPSEAMGGKGENDFRKEGDIYFPPNNITLAPYQLSAKPAVPVQGRITSSFGFRTNPITKDFEFHTGIDIAAPEGSAIATAFDGTVIETGESPIWGKYIKLSHSNNLTTMYCHASEVLVEQGTRLRQGETLAKVGATGYATGPHLHFEIAVNGVRTDPLTAFPAGTFQ